MSALQIQKESLRDDIRRESLTSGIQYSKRQCSSLRLCPHTPSTKSSSMTKTPDDRSSAESRFLNWVAYHRNLAGPSQITEDERLRCPIMWCRRLCDNQNELLEHVFKCTHYSNGKYWCFHCQMEESFSSCQCKHCQTPAFGKERLSVRVKRLLQKLGTKSHSKDHETLDSSGPSKGELGNENNRFSECLPQYVEASSVAVEMDINKTFRELEADYIVGPTELSGFDCYPAELDSENALISTSKQEIPNSTSEILIYPAGIGATHFASMPANIETAQALPLPSPDGPESASQFLNCHTINQAIPNDSHLKLQSPVSPQNADWSLTSYADHISESPTDTDFTNQSLFTSISPPSTRNTTMQSCPDSALSFRDSSYHQSTPQEMQDFLREPPKDMANEELSCHEQASNIQADTSPPTWRPNPVISGPFNLLTPNDLLKDFWKVLSLHVVESTERLKTLIVSPTVYELLSMTASMVAYAGFEAWQGIQRGNSPSSIAHLYSLVHVAYACAIVIYDGQVENQLRGLFTQSLSIGTRALSERDGEIYMSIAWSIWSPPLEENHQQLFPFAESTVQPLQTINGQSWANGKDPMRQNDNSELKAQSLHSKQMPSALEPSVHKENEILNVLNHFLDIFEGTISCNEVPSVFGNCAGGCKDENFIRMIKENVTNPLIEGHFQLGPSLEAFIKAVTKMETLLSIGNVTTIREVEVGLISAGKSIAQSMELYRIFSSRVKDLCGAVAYQLQLDPTLQIESQIEGINAMWIHLNLIICDSSKLKSDKAQWRKSVIMPRNSSSTLEQVISPPGTTMDDSAVDGLPQSTIQAGVYRRPAMKRKRPSSSSSISSPETRASPLSSASSKTLSESSESGHFCCPSCPFQPTGERRWHKRTMERHIFARHDPGHKKIHICDYDGCESSFTRRDNLAQHVRVVHQRTK